MRDEFDPAEEVLRAGLVAGAYPGCTVSVGSRAGAMWESALGRLSYEADAPFCHIGTIYDLASLTKVIGTASIAMAQIRRGQLSLDAPAGAYLPEWNTPDRAGVTIERLLDHSSGLPSRVNGWQQTTGRDGFRALLAATPLEHTPGGRAVYSDVGFLLLGLVLEETAGATLDAQFGALFGDTLPGMQFRPPEHLRSRIAPTELDPWRGRVLQGEVHDENAAAIGGVAGHAGLFGGALAVGVFARLVLETFHRETTLGDPALMRRFAARSAVPGSSRALAWDTALPTSSCGTRMTSTAIGHTGFTGTSLWIDWERDFYAVLLTNRVHPTRTNEQLIPLRSRFHDALPR